MAEIDSKQLASDTAQALVERLSDEVVVAKIADVWGRHLDAWLGRSFRRVVVYAFIGIVILASVKIESLSEGWAALRGGR